MSEVNPEVSVAVLVVDDEENILRSIARLLADEEYEVLTASSGVEGLRILAERKDIGVIVSDQRMPGQTGVEFLEKAREISPESLRLMLTGYADINASIDAINRGGACRYITKPWSDDELTQALRDAVDRAQLLRKNRMLVRVINRKNHELKEWNSLLEKRVLEQTGKIMSQNEELGALNARLRSTFSDSIAAFASLIELRDQGVRDHSRFVAEVAGKAASALALSESETAAVTTAALLHDIGKIGIPDVLLRKKAEDLDPGELEAYAQHPVRGQAAIDGIEDLRPAGVIIRHHHERYDGLGFPDGLRRKDIPIGARIVAIADAVDRMAGAFPGSADAVGKALEKVRTLLGSHFDPSVFPFVEKASMETIRKVSPKGPSVPQALRVAELRQGMVLAMDVRSGTGLLLLREGVPLDDKAIGSLKRYDQIDPLPTGVYVREAG